MSARHIFRSTAPVVGAGIVLAGGAMYAAQGQFYAHKEDGTAYSRTEAIPATIKAFSLDDPPKAFGSFGYHTLKLQSSEQVNHDTKRLRFELPDSNAVSGLKPISAVLTIAGVQGSWIPTFRPYTPVSDPATDRGYLDLLVKRYPEGKMSPHLHSLRPGDTHNFLKMPLSGGYNWPPKDPQRAEKHLALIAGGAGITPIYQLTKAIFRDAKSSSSSSSSSSSPQPATGSNTLPKITLLFGVNTPEDLLFHDEFRALEREYPDNFRCIYTVSHPPPSSPSSKLSQAITPNPDYETGYVDGALIAKHLPKPDVEGGVKVLLCGPPGMEASIAGKSGWFGAGSAGGVLGEMGYAKNQIVKL